MRTSTIMGTVKRPQGAQDINGERAQGARVMGVGILGLGTVGCGVVKALGTQADIIARVGWRPVIRRILVRNLAKERAVQVDASLLSQDPQDLLCDPDIRIIIEVIGGIEPARTCIRQALLAGKHVITANKELLAKHGAELISLAHRQGVRLMFEASVAGGIPIVRMVDAYLTANRVLAIRGILNGTCNYILTQMDERGQTFSEALYDAQQLGYAEADPESDIEGYDAAYKLCILANLAFASPTPITEVRRSGITAIAPIDLQMARQFGTALKLIGNARLVHGKPVLDVGLRFLPHSDALASVRDVFNAVTITADVVGDLTFIGRGAGELPTASAVIEDLMEVLRTPDVSLAPSALTEGLAVSTERCEAQRCETGTGSIAVYNDARAQTESWYVRIRVEEREPRFALGAQTALAQDGISCVFFATYPHATGVFDVVAVLEHAGAQVGEQLAELIGGECQFQAPFDAILPLAKDLVSTSN